MNTKAKFSCATSEVFNGLRTEMKWNGWECPLFELEEAQRVIEHFNYQQKTFGGEYYDLFTYLVDEDAILTQTFEEGKHLPQYDSIDKGTTIDGVRYYDIANCNYTWELVQD
jgi:hypothetical protein